MKLNKKLEIGINAVMALKNREGFVKTADLASEIGTTVNFLEQIMRNLRNGGLVKVKRGPGGGYSLVNGLNPEELNAFTVAKAVGRFTDNLTDGDASLPSQLLKNIKMAYLSTKL